MSEKKIRDTKKRVSNIKERERERERERQQVTSLT